MPQYSVNDLPPSAKMHYEDYLGERAMASHHEKRALEHRQLFEQSMIGHATGKGVIQPGRTMLAFHYGFADLTINIVPYTEPEPKKPIYKPTKPKIKW